MGFGSGRSLCRGEGFLGLPPPLGEGAPTRFLSLSYPHLRLHLWRGTTLTCVIMMMSTAFLWHRTVSSCVIYIAGQRPASAASSGAAAGIRAQLEALTASMETQNRGFFVGCGFYVLD